MGLLHAHLPRLTTTCVPCLFHSFKLEEVGWSSSSAKVTDVWAGGAPVTASGSFEFTVAPHAAEVFVLSPAAGESM